MEHAKIFCSYTAVPFFAWLLFSSFQTYDQCEIVTSCCAGRQTVIQNSELVMISDNLGILHTQGH